MSNNLPVLVLEDAYILPTSELRMDFDSKVDKKIFSMSESYYGSNIIIVSHTLTDQKADIDNLPRIGVLGIIKLHMDLPNGKTKIVVEGLKRIKIANYVQGEVLEAKYEDLVDTSDKKEETAYLKVLYNHLERYMEISNLSEEFLINAEKIDDLGEFTDFVVTNLPLQINKKAKYMAETSNIERAELLLSDIEEDVEIADLERIIY